MSSSVLPIFSSKSCIVSGLTLRSLIHSEFLFVYGVRKCSNLIFFFTCSYLVFPSPLIEETIFTPLYILAFFVKGKVLIGEWVNLWAFELVPLVYISVFVPVPYDIDDCGFAVYSEVRSIPFLSFIEPIFA